MINNKLGGNSGDMDDNLGKHVYIIGGGDACVEATAQTIQDVYKSIMQTKRTLHKLCNVWEGEPDIAITIAGQAASLCEQEAYLIQLSGELQQMLGIDWVNQPISGFSEPENG